MEVRQRIKSERTVKKSKVMNDVVSEKGRGGVDKKKNPFIAFVDQSGRMIGRNESLYRECYSFVLYNEG